ncbi:MAG: CDP-diacylglycerol--serine O-phosphatidyltransferase [Elusimicrobiota bacterium]
MLKKGIYILPSLFTLGNLCAGYISLIASLHNDFIRAAWAIFIASIFDMLDGRIARMTKTTSRFGVEFDSLADIVSFGLAPAVMIYQMVLFKYSKWGVILSFIFVMAGALRLARFNTKAGVDIPQSFFYGLPIPVAGNILAAFVLVYSVCEQEVPKKAFPFIVKCMPFFYKMMPMLVILLAYLMVSNIRYSSFKSLKLERRKPMKYLILISIAIVMIWRYPENMIFIILALYLLSGALDLLRRLRRLKQNKKIV